MNRLWRMMKKVEILKVSFDFGASLCIVPDLLTTSLLFLFCSLVFLLFKGQAKKEEFARKRNQHYGNEAEAMKIAAALAAREDDEDEEDEQEGGNGVNGIPPVPSLPKLNGA